MKSEWSCRPQSRSLIFSITMKMFHDPWIGRKRRKCFKKNKRKWEEREITIESRVWSCVISHFLSVNIQSLLWHKCHSYCRVEHTVSERLILLPKVTQLLCDWVKCSPAFSLFIWMVSLVAFCGTLLQFSPSMGYSHSWIHSSGEYILSALCWVLQCNSEQHNSSQGFPGMSNLRLMSILDNNCFFFFFWTNPHSFLFTFQ